MSVYGYARISTVKEVKDLRQRTKEGIETTRLNGKQIEGKPGVRSCTNRLKSF